MIYYLGLLILVRYHHEIVFFSPPKKDMWADWQGLDYEEEPKKRPHLRLVK